MCVSVAFIKIVGENLNSRRGRQARSGPFPHAAQKRQRKTVPEKGARLRRPFLPRRKSLGNEGLRKPRLLGVREFKSHPLH